MKSTNYVKFTEESLMSTEKYVSVKIYLQNDLNPGFASTNPSQKTVHRVVTYWHPGKYKVLGAVVCKEGDPDNHLEY